LAFKREIYEDIIYVLLNIMLAYKILNSFEINEGVNSEKFFTILTEIIREHYIHYSEEYKYLDDLRWYRINHYYSTTQLLEIYNLEMKSREAK
jgi:hemerythrin